MNPKKLKSTLLKICYRQIDERYDRINNSIKDIEASLFEESKSSAGDKHETGRAMLQIERENVSKQLLEVEHVRQALNKVDIDNPSDHVHLGSLVYTTQGIFFISISAGAIDIELTTYLAVSPNSPIGHPLMGKEKGEEFSFHDLDYTLTQVC